MKNINERCEIVTVWDFFCVFCFLDSADDMGLGKTLTMIALILTKKMKAKKEDEKKEEEKKEESWLSKTGDSLFEFV